MKHLSFLLLFFFVFSCAKQLQFENSTGDGSRYLLTKSADSLTFDCLEDFEVTIQDIREFIGRQKVVKEIHVIEPLINDQMQTYAYIARYSNGWELFSSDKRLPPVVACSDDGEFVLNYDNHGLCEWLKSLRQLTDTVKMKSLPEPNAHTEAWIGSSINNELFKKDSINNSKDGYSLWTRVDTESIYYNDYQYLIGPLLETKWGQDFPWNINLYNSYTGYFHATGCVAVALSQLIYYYHYKLGVPSGLYHNLSITDWDYYNYGDPYYMTNLSRLSYQDPSSRWNLFLKNKNQYSHLDTLFSKGAQYVSDLMVDVGNRADMHYFSDGQSSGSTSAGLDVLYDFGLAADYSLYSDSLARVNIEARKPFMITGQSGYTNPIYKHAWVVDGYRESGYTKEITSIWYMSYTPGLIPNGVCVTQEEVEAAALAAGYNHPEDGMVTNTYINYSPDQKKFHMNWGVDGESDGYYLSTSNVVINGNSYSFAYEQYMTNNIRIYE